MSVSNTEYYNNIFYIGVICFRFFQNLNQMLRRWQHRMIVSNS